MINPREGEKSHGIEIDITNKESKYKLSEGNQRFEAMLEPRDQVLEH